MKISMITVTYNSATDLRAHWSDISDAAVGWVVVDNASDDDSAEVARSLGADVVVLPRNVGFSAANNVGAAHAPADCYVFANPDVTIDTDTVRALADRAVQGDCIAAPQLEGFDGDLQEGGRSAPRIWRKLSHYTGLGNPDESYVRLARPGQSLEVSWVMGAVTVVPASLFNALQGWDSRFFIYYEDADICLRARQLGHPTFVEGSLRARHGWQRATRRSFRWSAWRHEFRSAAVFYRRYPRLLLPGALGRPRSYEWDG